jgi:hypothetical protein
MRFVFNMGRISSLVVMALVVASCGGGSKDAPPPSGPAPVSVNVTHVSLAGQAGWPGATTVAVKIDGTEIPVSAGVWTTTIDFGSETERTVTMTVVADGIDVAERELRVSRVAP